MTFRDYLFETSKRDKLKEIKNLNDIHGGKFELSNNEKFAMWYDKYDNLVDVWKEMESEGFDVELRIFNPKLHVLKVKL